MKLLVLSSWFPYPPDNGARLRAFHLLRELACQGHETALITGQQNDSPRDIPPELAELCEPGAVQAVPWVWHQGETLHGGDTLRALLSPIPRAIRETPNPALTHAIARSFSASQWDAVLVLQVGMDAYLPSFSPKRRVVLDEVELSSVMQGGGGLREKLTQTKAKHYWRTRLQTRGYAALTAVSEEEAHLARALVGSVGPPVFVVPNGVEVKAFPRRDLSLVVPNRLIHNGSLTYGLNRDAVRWFTNTVLPRIADKIPDVHLVITGRHTAEIQREWAGEPRVQLTGFLPDIRSALAQAAVCIVPLLGGGGTRLKVLEAWAAGVPVVSTRVGARGLEGVEGTHFLSADTPDAFAQHVVALLQNPAQGHMLAENARTLAETRYDWAAIARALEAILDPKNEP